MTPFFLAASLAGAATLLGAAWLASHRIDSLARLQQTELPGSISGPSSDGSHDGGASDKSHRPKVQPARELGSVHRFARAKQDEALKQARRLQAEARLESFSEWMDRWQASPPASRSTLLPEGRVVLEQRREALKSLIETDPRRALEHALTDSQRAALPAELQNRLETRIDARGSLSVMIRCDEDTDGPIRVARIGAQDYQAFVFGRRLAQGTKDNLPLHGIAIDGALALDESPFRRLTPNESDPNTASSPAAEIYIGEQRVTVPSSELPTLASFLINAESGLGPVVASVDLPQLGSSALSSRGPAGIPSMQTSGPDPWAFGAKRVLVIRIDFSDRPGASIGRETAQAVMDQQVKPFFERASYGQSSLVTTVTSKVYRMPSASAAYGNAVGIIFYGTRVADDARAAAQADHDVNAFDRIIVAYQYIPERSALRGGVAELGGRLAWISGNFLPGVVAHELGHTYGLNHANAWKVSDGNPFSSNGANGEYGDLFDTMGNSSSLGDFGMSAKNSLGWLPDSAVTKPVASGVHRIYAFNQPDGLSRAPLAIKVFRDGIRSYWIGFRKQTLTGAYVVWSRETKGYHHHTLDLNTPGDTFDDAVLQVGRSIADPERGVTIKPLASSGTGSSVYMDVQITLDEPARRYVAMWGDGSIDMPVGGIVGAQAIAAGQRHGLALLEDGTVKAWGDNARGQSTIPTGLNGVTAIAAGGDTNGAVTTGGTVWIWGDTSFGQGVVPGGLTGVKALAIGDRHVIALKTDGTVVAWGSNTSGQTSVPAGLSNVTAIAAGGSSSLALKSDGTVAAWGAALAGMPVNLTQVKAIALGPTHAVVLKTDSTVTAWGSSTHGKTQPPPSLNDVIAVAAGVEHSLALKSDGKVVAWGKLDTTLQVRPEMPAASAIAAGELVSLALIGRGGPVFTTHPLDQRVVVTSSVKFNVAAGGGPSVAYRWQSQSPGQSAWSDLSEGSGYSGTTSPILSIATAAQSLNGFRFRCLASNGIAANVASQSALLVVTGVPPQITNDVKSVYTAAGESATFSVTATGANSLSYQWRKNGVPISGATSASFTIASVQPSDRGHYDVVVGGDDGSTTISASGFLEPLPPVVSSRLRRRAAFAPRLERTRVQGYGAAFAPDGRFYAAGDFCRIDDQPSTGVARFHANGSHDPTFVTPPILGGQITALAVQSDGKLLVGGYAAIGGRALGPIARLNIDGSLDTSFQFTGATGTFVYEIIVMADGRILVAGIFRRTGAPATAYLIRLAANGSIDPAWTGTGAADSTVLGIGLQPDGKILAGGYFTKVDGIDRKRVARFNSDGTLDLSFDSRDGFDAEVYDVGALPGGDIVAVGSFSTYRGTTRKGLARLKSDGSIDPSSSQAAPLEEASVQHLDVRPDGKVLISGAFESVAGSTRLSIATLNPDFTLATAFDSLYTFEASLGESALVRNVAVNPNGGYVICGTFTGINQTRRPGFAVLDAQGGLLSDPSPILRSPGIAHSVEPAPNGAWLVAGQFDWVNDMPCSGLALISSTGLLDTALDQQPAKNSHIFRSTLPMPDGDVLLAGQFTSMQGAGRRFLAAVARTGLLDTQFAAYATAGIFASDGVYSAALQPDGRIIAGGRFERFNGIASKNIARLQRDGALDPTFKVGTGFNDTVDRLAVAEDGKIYAAGAFTTYQGASNSRLIRLHPDGLPDTAFSAGTRLTGPVAALIPQANGGLLIGGGFPSFAGRAVGYIARLTATGDLDSTFSSGNGFNNRVSAISTQIDGRLLVAGNFTAFQGVAALGLARLNTDGTLDRSFSVANYLEGQVMVLRQLATGEILAAGSAMKFTDGSVSSLVIFEPDPLPHFTTQPTNQSLSVGARLELKVQAGGAAPLSYQWLKSGTAIPGATSATFVVLAAKVEDSGSYTCVVSNPVGSATSSAATVTVNALPVIVAQPVSRAIRLGSSVTFSVSSTSSTAQSYLWLKNGQPTNSVGSSYFIGNIGLTDAARYACRITNAAGSVTTEEATLTLMFRTTQDPVSRVARLGAPATFTASADAGGAQLTYQWRLNGEPIANSNSATHIVAAAQPTDVGAYRVTISAPNFQTYESPAALLNLESLAKLVGAGTEFANILHPSGVTYDQILLEGSAATITADPGQVTRISFIDLSDDIVQVEFSGSGSLTLRLDNISGPAPPIKYNQNVAYVKGHATLTLSGVSTDSHLSVFTVGRLNAVNQALFRDNVSYDGVADIAAIHILGFVGRFGGIRAANAEFTGIRGQVGINAPGVRFGGPLNIHNIAAAEGAEPILLTGLIDSGFVGIAGGDMFQLNGQAVRFGTAQKVRMMAGTTSHNVPMPAQNNLGRYERDGQNVTAQVVEGP